MDGQPTPGRRLLFGAVLVALVLASVEGASRVYMTRSLGTPLGAPGRAIQRFYPELDDIEGETIPRQKGELDVLLLAGSVLHPAWGTVAHALGDELALRTRRHVRIHNAAGVAHTSLDSLHKYRRLADKRFDLVVVYHAINEVRTNNVPDADFRADYSHMDWYRRVNWVADHDRILRVSALPYALHDGRMLLEQALGRYRPIPQRRPDPETLRYGAHVKSAASLRRNLEAILDLARERGDPVLLATFAWHLPPDYSPERFRARALDYDSHGSAVELWGDPPNVVAGLEAHNAVIRELAAERPDVLFLDAQARMPREGRYWNDVCHLSARGGLAFAELIADLLESRGVLGRAPAGGGARGAASGRASRGSTP